MIDDATRLQELASRRARVAERTGAKNLLVLFSAEPRVYTNDVDYEYRQENNFYYLTNLRQAGATLVIMPGNAETPELLFLPRRNPSAETWRGKMYSAEEAARRSGIREIWAAEEFEPFMRSLADGKAYSPKPNSILLSTRRSNSATTQSNSTANVANVANANTPNLLLQARSRRESTLYMLTPDEDEQRETTREWRQEARFATRWEQTASGFPVQSAWAIFSELRLRKSPLEVRLLQHAIDITIEGLGRAMATAGTLKWEYEAEAEVEYTFKRRGADYWGYPSIVGCGPNATTLHYWESAGRIAPSDLLLMDTGAEYDHYTADVTRTFPVSGRFTPEQADIYNIVLAAQDAAIRSIRVGGSFADTNRLARDTVRDGLLRLGLITDAKSEQYRIWFMHGTSHWLGMNVHDVGGMARFAPGTVFTVEPGIYIREDALDVLPKTPENERFIAAVRPAFERYKNIGVRIEDDILITEDGGVRNMSAALPRTIPDIEAFIAQASKELKVSAISFPSFKDLPLTSKRSNNVYRMAVTTRQLQAGLRYSHRYSGKDNRIDRG